ncbi:MAG: hypothetical protein A3F53_00495 [Candidatus Zambryskibacteria bacterium RIFCSPHIGHO2_12_FULL_48_10]|uniref:phosphoglycerate kinase n=1 Tax=Candidatus Zambryskibacteria bacterium RIFCSPHIGHO2_01_FULL_46_25 TaxID=1802738 RepID=A0A1G2SYN7_9BACT|nr:MAG: Phosphoglycerate kinase [Parcubacteria group bacterium GW2011_GWA1_47_10]OHA90113.1 MAG: hypothetical protein A2838_00580 [Candidatus Zambryskibacteria bacterium RIFCSPHIGHO2_01_FULL_46_25]OHB02024.1 MAG: hypothetical protein A3F53_00495 [Candidatus Zambryskibacteria bacterium RIFCSPHIGHO2_12_FULL_48_10]OHB06512.1 MAG: hypothetical protein A3A31_02675 [Candidatus Zambryskibacteria bacterium RIFCSPLOWO2_01_FULL_48_25]
MKSVTEAGDLQGKRVLVRVDWSIPDLKNDFQIRATLPTLEYLEKMGAKIIVATHLENETIEDLKRYLPEGAELLPNLRDNPGEEANSEEFAKELANKADIYVNEAFSVSHREHASIVGVPKFLPSYAGIEFMEEIAALSKAFHPPHPFILLLGGAKFDTKLPLVQKFAQIADKVFIAGAMAAKVPEVMTQNPKVVLPVGDIAALDADDNVINQISGIIADAKFILWNGPLGKYEKGYTEGTLKLARLLAESGKEVIVGGANTLAAIKELNIYDKFTFVSTAGGAMLEFLATETLPGIQALE